MKAFKLDVNHVYDVLATDSSDDIEELLKDPALEDSGALSEFFAIVAIVEDRSGLWDGNRDMLIDFVSKRLDFKRFVALAMLSESGTDRTREYSNVSQELKKALRSKEFSEESNCEIKELYGKSAKQVVKYAYFKRGKINSGYIPTLVKLMFREWCTDYGTLYSHVSMSISEKPENA